MNPLNRFTNTIQDQNLQRLYREKNYTSVLRTGIVLFIIKMFLYTGVFAMVYFFPDDQNGKMRFIIWKGFFIVLQVLTLILIRVVKGLFIEMSIPVLLLLEFLSNDASQYIPINAFVWNSLFVLNLWYIHLVSSNLNWLLTSSGYLIGSLYIGIGYIIQPIKDDDPIFKYTFLSLIYFINIVYVWLAFNTDKQKKLNFCHNFQISQQKSNLLDILEFFPESLMIISQNQDQNRILYKNTNMNELESLSKRIIYDKTIEQFVIEEESTSEMSRYFNLQQSIDNTGNFNQASLDFESDIPSFWSSLVNKNSHYERIAIKQSHSNEASDMPLQNAKAGYMFEFQSKEVIFDQEPCRLMVIRDVSELVKSEYLKSVEKISDIMIASTSHDMRTPMNTIINMLNLISQRVQGEPLSKWIRIANNSTNLLQYLVNDTLDYFQIKSGKFSILVSQVNLHELGERVLELISIQMEQKSLQKILEVDEDLKDIQFIADQKRLSQILVNLVSNALKFTFQGFIKIKISKLSQQEGSMLQTNKKLTSFDRNQQQVDMKASTQIKSSCGDCHKKQKILFSVSDSGIGIKEEDQGKLFKIFGKISSSDEVNPSGIGLGLTICNKILNQLGGQISVVSEYGKGTNFYFTLDLEAFSSISIGPNDIECQVCNQTISDDLELNIIQKTFETHRKNPQLLPKQRNSEAIIMQQQNNQIVLNNSEQLLLSDSCIADELQLTERKLNGNFSLLQFNRFTFHQQQQLNQVKLKEEESESLIIREQPRMQQCSCCQILIVDDNDFNIFSLQTILKEEFKLDSVSAYNGEQAITLLKNRVDSSQQCFCKGTFKLIFMDISMPIMDGYQATKAIRELEVDRNLQRQYIVGLSAHATEKYKLKSLQVQMDEFMTKPIEAQQLKSILLKLDLK